MIVDGTASDPPGVALWTRELLRACLVELVARAAGLRAARKAA